MSEHTKGSNTKTNLQWISAWIVDSWNKIPEDLIIQIFRIFGITIAIDEKEDRLISTFKPDSWIWILDIEKMDAS